MATNLVTIDFVIDTEKYLEDIERLRATASAVTAVTIEIETLTNGDRMTLIPRIKAVID